VRRNYQAPVMDYVRAALARGPLTRVRQRVGRGEISHYQFGRRMFNAAIVNRAIEAGEAIRDGDQVRSA
jgi:hypothetical protein